MEYKAKKAYQDKDTVSKYDKERFRNLKGFLVHKRELNLICKTLSFAKITPPAAILDIPCGTGRLSIYLGQKGFKVKSADISKEMLAYTGEKIKTLNLTDKVTAETGDIESLPYQDNSFDVCISLRLFGHIPTEVRRKALQELKRITREYLILIYYHKNCLQNFLRRKRRYNQKVEWHPVTYKQMEEEMESAGLEIIKCFPLLKGISETIAVLAKKKK